MKVDKTNGNVKYNDEFHMYWDDNEDKYISVTTLIGKFEQPYDKEFWSAYKAFQKLVPQEGFVLEKQKLLNTKKFNKELLGIYNITELEFNKCQQGILDEWQRTNTLSCERGTKIHAQLENSMYKPKLSLQKFGIGGEFTCIKNHTELDLENGVYPEYLIYYKSKDEELKLAGQIDLLIKKGNHITIIDYKTNKSIDQKSYFDSSTKSNTKMKYPLTNIMDCNFWHYTMQLSMYAWMIQQLNPDYVIDLLMIIHFDHDNNVKKYDIEYRKDDVIKMLKYYKYKDTINKQLDKVKPIQY